MSRVSHLITTGPWSVKHLALLRQPRSTSSSLWSIQPTPIRPGLRFITRASSFPIATAHTSPISLSSRTRRHVELYAPNPVSRRLQSASSSPEQTPISFSDAVLQTNITSVKNAFAQLPKDPLSFLQAPPAAFLQTLNLRPLPLDVVYNHVLKVIHAYCVNVRDYKKTSKAKNVPALSPDLRTKLNDSYVLYRDFWDETARNPKIPTETRDQMNQNMRQHQLDLLKELENWQEIYLLVQQLQKEARKERKTRSEGGGKDQGKKVNMALDTAYEERLQKIAYAYFGSLRERQVEPQSALRFLSPILSSLASSSSADRVAFASKNLFRFYGWARVQLVPSAIASDSTAEYAWLKTDNPLSAFASTVFAVIEKSPKLSSEGLLGRLTYALQHEPRSKSYKLDSIAQLVVREGLSLDQLTITLIIRKISLTRPNPAIQFVRHLNSRRIAIDDAIWQLMAKNFIRSTYDPIRPDRVAQMYELVPKKQRKGVEWAVSRAFAEERPTLKAVFTRQEVRAALGAHGVDDGAIESMCGTDSTATEVATEQGRNGRVVGPVTSDGESKSEGQEKTTGRTFQGKFAADEVKAAVEK